VGVRLTLAVLVFVAVGVLVVVKVMVGGNLANVAVEMGVEEGRMPIVSVGAKVQVGGSERKVGVAEGIITTAGNVGGGNGFNTEYGFSNIIPKPRLIPTTAAIKNTVRMSQVEIFMAFQPFHPSTYVRSFGLDWCQYIRF
jgi:hypothetical protein